MSRNGTSGMWATSSTRTIPKARLTRTTTTCSISQIEQLLFRNRDCPARARREASQVTYWGICSRQSDKSVERNGRAQRQFRSTRISCLEKPSRKIMASTSILSKISRRALLVTGFALATTSLAPAQAQPQGPETQVDLIAETASIQPGKPFTVAVRMQLEPEWHVYWQNPGDSGTPVRIDWKLPAGFKAGPIQWPKPHLFVFAPLVSYGYDNEVWLLTQITPPANLAPGKPVTLNADVDWLICSEQCVPQDKSVSLGLNVAADKPAASADVAAQFVKARAEVPAPATQVGVTVRAEVPFVKAATKNPAASRINLRFTPTAGTTLSPERLKKAYFYVADTYVLTHPTTQTALKEGNSYRIPLTRAEDAEPIKSLRGTLVVPALPGGAADALSKGVWVDTPLVKLQALPVAAKKK
ncbi:MAG: hypothetical protein EOO39_00965 [Cytophagaceae bacterium]|nr:MAG: hypothetical protein EOO39_00965 [Cytophagaceae bacterium]